MDQIESWMDPDAVRRMALRLLQAPEGPVPPARDEAGFELQFVGFTVNKQEGDPVPPPRVIPPTEPALAPTARPGPRAADAAPPPPPAEPPRQQGKLVERLQYFREWLITQKSAKGMFVVDRRGDPILEDPAYSKLYFLARSLAQAQRPSNPDSGNAHVKITPDTYLAVIPAETLFGRLILGVILPQPFEPATVASLARALVKVAQPQLQ